MTEKGRIRLVAPHGFMGLMKLLDLEEKVIYAVDSVGNPLNLARGGGMRDSFPDYV